MIDSIGIKSEEVILKPFNYSELVSILKEPGMSYNNNLINKLCLVTVPYVAIKLPILISKFCCVSTSIL